MNSKIALVTGVTGQDGAYLSQLLLDKSYVVFCAYCRTSSVNFWRIEELGCQHHPVALRQAMQYLWEHPEQAAEMGRRAEDGYWKHFTADQMVRSYVDLYRDLIKNHHPA